MAQQIEVRNIEIVSASYFVQLVQISSDFEPTSNLQLDNDFAGGVISTPSVGTEINADDFTDIVDALSKVIFHTHEYSDKFTGNCNCNCNCTRGIL